MNKFFKLAALLILSVGSLSAQTNTTVSGTVTDPDGLSWAGGTIQFNLYNPSGGQVTSNGVPVTPAQSFVTFNMNTSGAFSGSLLNNAQLQPVGTQWTATVCSATTAPCQQLPRITISGATQVLTSTINSQLNALRFPASYNAKAYNSVEISPIPPPGGTYYDLTAKNIYFWDGTTWRASGSGSVTPSGPAYSMQLANLALTGLTSDPFFTVNPITHTMDTSAGNALVGALSSAPQAVFDPMDTKYDGGLAAAIAGTSGFTPAQVINLAIDTGECSAILNSTPFHAINIPLPNGVTMNISGVKVWSGVNIGGSSPTQGPNLQHNDSSQVEIIGHAAGDALICGGTTYHPASGGVGGVFIHDIGISGMFNPATYTDIGIELNMFSSAAVRIRGFGNAFGASAVLSNGTSDFIEYIGYPGSQVQGCKTFNTGVLAVSGYTAGSGVCGSVQDGSLDGGDDHIYASDGQAFATNHAAGPCYPGCAAMVLSGNGEYSTNLFLQVSGIGMLIGGFNQKIQTVRIDFTSREAFHVVSGGATATIIDSVVDTACTDKALLTNYNLGIATGCFGATVPNGSRLVMSNYAVGNNVGIFDQAYMQAEVSDQNNSGSGVSSQYLFGSYQGNADNATANNLLIVENGGSKISPMVYFPDRNVEAASTTTPNVSGITYITLVSGQTVTNFLNAINGQHLYVQGNGIVQNNAQIQNQNLLDNSVTTANGYTPTLEYIYSNGLWRQIAGPANQTPTHINYSGNPVPSNPSLNSVYGNVQPMLVPGFSIAAAVQLHGPAAVSGQACFEEKASFDDGSYVVSSLTCSNVELTTQTPGEIFVATTPQAVLDLYMVSNTEPNGITTGKYTRHTSLWDGPTVVALGGDGNPSPAAGENNTGRIMNLPNGISGPATAPSGACTAGYGGEIIFSQDGHATFCPVGGGTWTTKF